MAQVGKLGEVTLNQTESDKKALVEELLGIFQNPKLNELRKFEKVLWLLPSFWSMTTLAKLSFVHLEALAKFIVCNLIEEDVELTYAEEKTARVMSLVLHLAGVICTEDAFKDDKNNVQQKYRVKEACVSILSCWGCHPAINLQITRACIRMLANKVCNCDEQTSIYDHVCMEEIYWMFHILEKNLSKEITCLSHLDSPLGISRWPVVKEATETIIEIEKALFDIDNKFSKSFLFMSSWRKAKERLSLYFAC